jgi:hypothetical protein
MTDYTEELKKICGSQPLPNGRQCDCVLHGAAAEIERLKQDRTDLLAMDKTVRTDRDALQDALHWALDMYEGVWREQYKTRAEERVAWARSIEEWCRNHPEAGK